MDAWIGLMFIMLAFLFRLNGSEMFMNVGLLVATLAKIVVSVWCLAVNSTKEKNRRQLKWQCLLTQVVSGMVLCFSQQVGSTSGNPRRERYPRETGDRRRSSVRPAVNIIEPSCVPYSFVSLSKQHSYNTQ
jgi:hypothetical protein